jgi:membrane protease YdiL (CAAX protease family)
MGRPWMPRDDRRAVHHSIPLPHNYNAEDDLVLPLLPVIDRERAEQPVGPGMPPLRHVPLPPPETLQLKAPGAPTHHLSAARQNTMPAERVRFPVAGPPPVRLSTPAPTVTTPPTAPAIQPEAASATAAAVTPSPARPTAAPAPVEPGAQAEPGVRIEPLFGLALYLALGLGTLFLSVEDRYTVLWAALFLLGGAARLTAPRTPPSAREPGGLFWGVGVGLVFSLPLLILTGRGLAETVSVLFPDYTRAALFQTLVFAMPLGETLFFRGAIQERHGFAAGVAAAALSSLLLFWPAASGTPVYLFAGLIFSGVLAGVYSYVHSRYGLIAAYTCQVTANVMLLFIPGALLQIMSTSML